MFRSNATYLVIVLVFVIVFSVGTGIALSFLVPPPVVGNPEALYVLADSGSSGDVVPSINSDFAPLTVGQSVTTPDGIVIFFVLADNEQKDAIVQIKYTDGQISNPTHVHKDSELKVGERSRIIARELLDNNNNPTMVIEYWSTP